MNLSLQKFLTGLAAILLINAAFAADSRVDVSSIVNKAEAEAVLDTKVKDATPRNVLGGDGYYSKCNYYSITPGKILLLRVYQAAPGYDGRRELEAVTKNAPQVKLVAGLGDKAVVTSGKQSGLPARVTMLYVSKGSNLITVGLSGMPDQTATLEKAKDVAQKILTHL